MVVTSIWAIELKPKSRNARKNVSLFKKFSCQLLILNFSFPPVKRLLLPDLHNNDSSTSSLYI